MRYYILLGPPGAGKGTQAKVISEKYFLVHLSTGELLRTEISKGTELGKIAAKLINDGNFVSDEIVIKLLMNKIAAHPDAKGFLLDGFPRNISQAEYLDKALEEKNASVEAVISITLEDKYIYDRILHRAEIEGRKDDMSKETIKHRIETYHEKTEPLIQYYKNQNKYLCIDGNGSIMEVKKKILEVIKPSIQ